MKKLTPIKSFSIALIISSICTIALFVLQYFILGIVGIILSILLFIFWYRYLKEELILNYLQSNNGQMEYTKMVEKLSKSVSPALNRLKDKGIIEIKDDIIKLVDQNYISIFTKCRMCKIK